MSTSIATALSLLLLPANALVQDWTNTVGNESRDGSSPTFGPLQPDLAWEAGPPLLIGWEPIVADGRVFSVRQSGVPPAGEPNGSPIVAQDLETGQVLWTVDLPYAAGDWTTWIGGARDGVVYANRAGNGGTASAPLVALDQATGATLWTSAEEIRAGVHDGWCSAATATRSWPGTTRSVASARRRAAQCGRSPGRAPATAPAVV